MVWAIATTATLTGTRFASLRGETRSTLTPTNTLKRAQHVRAYRGTLSLPSSLVLVTDPNANPNRSPNPSAVPDPTHSTPGWCSRTGRASTSAKSPWSTVRIVVLTAS